MKTFGISIMCLCGVMMFVLCATMISCTENQRARSYGGKMIVNLPCDHKLVNATWKVESLWYLTRSIRAGEAVENLEFKEDSSYGLLNGTVVFSETTCK